MTVPYVSNPVPMWLQEAGRFTRLKDLRLVSNDPNPNTARARVRDRWIQLYPSRAFYHPFAIQLYKILSKNTLYVNVDTLEEKYFTALERWHKGDPDFDAWLGIMELAND